MAAGPLQPLRGLATPNPGLHHAIRAALGQTAQNLQLTVGKLLDHFQDLGGAVAEDDGDVDLAALTVDNRAVVARDSPISLRYFLSLRSKKSAAAVKADTQLRCSRKP